MAPGPTTTGILDQTGTGWARVDGPNNWVFDHELQHALPFPKDSLDYVPRGGAIEEMISSAAEAIAGEDSLPPPNSDASYTWSLLGYDPGGPSCGNAPSCTCLRSVGQNYQGWRSFTAYLASNFRGTDTGATLAALQDDRLYLWARTSDRSLKTLGDLLTDANCAECAQKPYFKDFQGTPLPAHDRLQMLIHNWRVANYVDNPDLASHQYGFPTQFGFSPKRDIAAWRGVDACKDSNDIIVVPPSVTVGTRQLTRDTTFVGTRYRGQWSYPMILQPFGAEYWEVRADGALAGSTQDLVVRVAPEGIHRTESAAGPNCDISPSPAEDGRLMASVVGYTYNADTLWKNPQKAELAVAPRGVDVDSVARDLELVVPNFGSTYKAAVVVITLEDGPTKKYSASAHGIGYVEALPYRITLALRKTPADTLTPTALVQTANQADDSPTWSPSGTEIAFSSRIGGATYAKIYRVSATGGTPTALTPTTSHNQYRPDWSPRGDWIAYERDSTGSQSDIWRYDVTTSTLERVTSQSGLASWPCFGPNGRFLAYVRKNGLNWELHRVFLSSGADLVLVGPVVAEIKSPRWTSDAKAIYFTKNDSLYAVSSSGGTVYAKSQLLGSGSATEFDLHRGQGRLILEQPGSYPYVRHCGDGDHTFTLPYRRISVRDTLASDTQTRFYQTGVSFYNPRWSPNGTRVAYSADPNQNGDRDLFVGQVSYNHAPVFYTIGDQFLTACDAFTMNVSATDADGEAITYKADYLPGGASLSSSGQFQWMRPYPAGDYYVVFRAFDGSGGVDSKVVLMSVVDMGGCGEGFAGGGGGGGGGSLMANLGDDVAASIGTNSPGSNSLFAGAPSGQAVWDALRLPDPGSGLSYSASLKTGSGRGASLDGVRLQLIDHSADARPYLVGQSVVLGRRVAATQALAADDANVTALLDGTSREAFTGSAGSYVTLTLAGEAGDPLVLETRRLSQELSASGGVQVQVPDGSGWRQVTQLAPRRNFDEAAIDCGSTTKVRLAFASDTEVRFAGRLARSSETPTVSWATLDAAQDAKAGDVKSAVLTADGTTASVTGPDTLNASFTLPSLASGQSRDCFLWVQGSLAGASATSGESSVLAGEMLPTEFALFQNQPNPFSGTTAIRFALPHGSVVRLEVFDIQGRRVAMLANSYLPAGYHALQWDHRSEGGAQVSAGVYHYRIEAGSFRAKKKMVLLP